MDRQRLRRAVASRTIGPDGGRARCRGSVWATDCSFRRDALRRAREHGGFVANGQRTRRWPRRGGIPRSPATQRAAQKISGKHDARHACLDVDRLRERPGRRGSGIRRSRSDQGVFERPASQQLQLPESKNRKKDRRYIQIGATSPNGACQFHDEAGAPSNQPVLKIETAVERAGCRSLMMEGSSDPVSWRNLPAIPTRPARAGKKHDPVHARRRQGAADPQRSDDASPSASTERKRAPRSIGPSRAVISTPGHLCPEPRQPAKDANDGLMPSIPAARRSTMNDANPQVIGDGAGHAAITGAATRCERQRPAASSVRNRSGTSSTIRTSQPRRAKGKGGPICTDRKRQRTEARPASAALSVLVTVRW